MDIKIDKQESIKSKKRIFGRMLVSISLALIVLVFANGCMAQIANPECLSMTKTASETAVTPGESIIYTYVITNTCYDAADATMVGLYDDTLQGKDVYCTWECTHIPSHFAWAPWTWTITNGPGEESISPDSSYPTRGVFLQNDDIITCVTTEPYVINEVTTNKARITGKISITGDDIEVYGWAEETVRTTGCVVIIDEETIDNGVSTIEKAAYSHRVKPDWLVNDNNPVERGNPWLNWNTHYPGDIVTIPSGEVDDEGLFALPEEIRYMDNEVRFPFRDMNGNLIENTEDWVAAFVDGTLPQDKLDKVLDVMPFRNPDLASLVGQTCVAVVYDSDVSMNYEPINANLQGGRYGRFAFTVLDVKVPSLPESGSSSSLYDLVVRVEGQMDFTVPFIIPVRDHEPDSIEITRATCRRSTLKVYGESDFAPDAEMTVSIEGVVSDAPMTYNSRRDRYEYKQRVRCRGMSGKLVTISTDAGGSDNGYIE